jgi:hypothetical protein
MRICLLALVATIAVCPVNATEQKADSLLQITSHRLDSITATITALQEVQLRSRIADSVGAQYLEILHRTNQQVNLWHSPLAWYIACLAALITVMSIIAAAIFFALSREYRGAIGKLQKDYAKLVADLRSDFEKQRSEHKKEQNEYLDARNAELQKKLKSLEETMTAEGAKDKEVTKLLKKQVEEIKAEMDRNAEIKKLPLTRLWAMEPPHMIGLPDGCNIFVADPGSWRDHVPSSDAVELKVRRD